MLPTQITESNGNYIQIAYKQNVYNLDGSCAVCYPPMAIDYVTDTLGRVIQFSYSGTTLIGISPPGGSGASFGYSTVTLNTDFQGADVPTPTENAPVSFQGISSVLAPARPQYQFSYSGYGMIYRIAFQGGNSVTYDYPLGGEPLYFTTPKFMQRTESPNALFTYSSEFGSAVITRPDSSKLYLNSSTIEVKNSSGASLAKTVYTYTNDPGGQQQVQSITTYDETGKATKVDFDCDIYGNVINKREYGYQINGAVAGSQEDSFHLRDLSAIH